MTQNLYKSIAYSRIMQRVLFFVFLFLSFTVSAQTPRLVDMQALQKIMTEPTEKIQVINFWATWCAPCIKELPLFEKLNAEDKKSKVYLVSLDYDLNPDPEKVTRFVVRKNIKSDVLILTEKDPNSWIDKVDPSWSGSIPATLVINTQSGKRKFIPGELKEGELEQYIEEVNH